MIIPLIDVLDSEAKQKGFTSWDNAVDNLQPNDLHKIYEEAAIALSQRAIHVAWDQRASLVSHRKDFIDKRKSDLLSDVKRRLRC